MLGTVIQMAFTSIYFGTVAGFNTIVAIATQGWYLSYAMPLCVRVLSFYNENPRKFKGPWAMKPAVSFATNFVGLAYLFFACITFNLPSVSPVTSENMNYTSAAVVAIMVIAELTWIFKANKQFSGPTVDAVVDIIAGDPTFDVEDEKQRRSYILKADLNDMFPVFLV
jgi:choline transport protein